MLISGGEKDAGGKNNQTFHQTFFFSIFSPCMGALFVKEECSLTNENGVELLNCREGQWSKLEPHTKSIPFQPTLHHGWPKKQEILLAFLLSPLVCIYWEERSGWQSRTITCREFFAGIRGQNHFEHGPPDWVWQIINDLPPKLLPEETQIYATS